MEKTVSFLGILGVGGATLTNAFVFRELPYQAFIC